MRPLSYLGRYRRLDSLQTIGSFLALGQSGALPPSKLQIAATILLFVDVAAVFAFMFIRPALSDLAFTLLVPLLMLETWESIERGRVRKLSRFNVTI